MSTMVELPVGVEHGTPAGSAAGCRKDTQCPALYEHGMACLYAHLRSQNDVRYFKAKARDPRPAAIARALGMTPEHSLANVKEQEIDQSKLDLEREARSAGRQKREAAKTPDAAQPLAESAKDSEPQEDAGAPAIETETPTDEPIVEPAVEDEAMGHPTTPEETPDMTIEADLPTSSETDAPSTHRAEKLTKIRAWAAENKIPVATFGRVPKDVEAAYDANDPTLVAKPKVRKLTLAPMKPAEQPPALSEPLDLLIAGITNLTGFPQRSDQLDETRARIADAPGPHPEWAAVAISEDVENARSIAARLEQENAHLLEQLATAHNSLALVLTKYDQLTIALAEAEEKASAARRDPDRALAKLVRFELEAQLGDERASINMLRHELAHTQHRLLIAELERDLARHQAPIHYRPWWKFRR